MLRFYSQLYLYDLLILYGSYLWMLVYANCYNIFQLNRMGWRTYLTYTERVSNFLWYLWRGYGCDSRNNIYFLYHEVVCNCKTRVNLSFSKKKWGKHGELAATI